jgi:hypothetical protein
MSEDSHNPDPFAALIGLAIVGAVLILCVVYVLLPLAVLTVAGGACWGGGHAVINYLKAFSNNVKWR